MIELKGVDFSYGSKQALTDITVRFEDGSFTAVIGENGSGKSTLISVITGEKKPIGGIVTVDGKDISLIRRRELARLLSVFPQGRPVPDMTAGEMVLMGRYPFRRGFAAFSDDDVAMAEKALVSADASEFGGRNMKALSYGERQRVYLAMQMAQNTRNCVLDEPTNFMDASHSFQILDYVKRMSAEEGKCVVCVLHDIPLAMRYADRLVILKNGGIYADGAPDELFEGGDIARAFNIRLERFSVNGGYAYSVLPG